MLYISIHSPNQLPNLDFDVFKEIDLTQVTTIKYSELRIKRLGKGYNTDCYSYDSEINFKYYRMRSDCVNDCYQDKMRHKCNTDRGFYMSNNLLRKDYLSKGNDKILSCNITKIIIK